MTPIETQQCSCDSDAPGYCSYCSYVFSQYHGWVRNRKKEKWLDVFRDTYPLPTTLGPKGRSSKGPKPKYKSEFAPDGAAKRTIDGLREKSEYGPSPAVVVSKPARTEFTSSCIPVYYRDGTIVFIEIIDSIVLGNGRVLGWEDHYPTANPYAGRRDGVYRSHWQPEHIGEHDFVEVEFSLHTERSAKRVKEKVCINCGKTATYLSLVKEACRTFPFYVFLDKKPKLLTAYELGIPQHKDVTHNLGSPFRFPTVGAYTVLPDNRCCLDGHVPREFPPSKLETEYKEYAYKAKPIGCYYFFEATSSGLQGSLTYEKKAWYLQITADFRCSDGKTRRPEVRLIGDEEKELKQDLSVVKKAVQERFKKVRSALKSKVTPNAERKGLHDEWIELLRAKQALGILKHRSATGKRLLDDDIQTAFVQGYDDAYGKDDRVHNNKKSGKNAQEIKEEIDSYEPDYQDVVWEGVDLDSSTLATTPTWKKQEDRLYGTAKEETADVETE